MLTDKSELGAWLRMTQTPGVGHRAWCRLLGVFGSPEAVFCAPDSSLQQHITEKQIKSCRTAPPDWPHALDSAWQWCGAGQDGSKGIVALNDPHYPKSLLTLDDPPLLLYVRGQIQAWLGEQGETPAALAIVGSRNPTPQGVANARDLARASAKAGLCVVSGLALGVDSAAHEGALGSDMGFATVAVVGTGLDRVYPRRNHALAHRVAERGVLLSEYPLGTPPLPANFPRRNRLIAALSMGTLVVEAALESGSLITARLALDLGQTVFAVPGSIHSPQSRGCHALLRDGACLVETVEDILSELPAPWSNASPAASTRPTGGALAAGEETPLLLAMGWDACSAEDLAMRLHCEVAPVLAQLSEWELSGQVARLPGGRYQRQAGVRPG